MAQFGDGARLMTGRSHKTARVRIPPPAPPLVRGWLSPARRRSSKPQVPQDPRGSNPLPRACLSNAREQGGGVAQDSGIPGGIPSHKTSLPRFALSVPRPVCIDTLRPGQNG